jgi:cytochrome c peroxidase
MKKGLLLITLFTVVFGLSAYVADKKFPSYFPTPIFEVERNTDKIELGRLLFYDVRLSANNTISCASCHSPVNGFAHADHALSHGINDSILTRNAPALFNLAWQKDFMWDGAIHSLLAQPLAPISNSKEMGSNVSEVLQKLNASTFYKKKFFNAYADKNITTQLFLEALRAFQSNLISAGSKYDSVRLNLSTFSNQEQKGYLLFKRNCKHCHTEPLFTNAGFANNGLPIDPLLKDIGRYNLTHLAEDSMMFKVPSLRNLSYTFPYMHDGRFNTLNEVMNHYTKGIQKGKSLSPYLSEGLILQPEEKVDLIAFLLTLNDKNFLRNKSYAFPNELK